MPINSVTFGGNLTRDAELRMSKAGNPVLSFAIAVNNRRKGVNGVWEDDPMYMDCVMFGNRAQKIADAGLLAKGVKVVVSGKLTESHWEKDGQKRSRKQTLVDEIEIQRPTQNRQSQPNQNPTQTQTQPTGYPTQTYGQPTGYAEPYQPNYQQANLPGSGYADASY